MKKLYEVEVIVRAVIVADDMGDAIRVAMYEARDIVRNDDLDDADVVCEIKNAAGLPQGWDAQCIPFGGDGNTRIEHYLANLPPERDTKTIDMFAVAEPVGAHERKAP